MKKVTAIACILCMFFLGNQPALYAEDEDKGSSQDAGSVKLEPIVVTPWRATESISDVSRAVTIISQEDIQNSKARDISELLRNYSGVSVANYFGNPKGVVVDIRGFGETSPLNILLLIDGRRVNQIDISGIDWSQVDLNSVEKVEIVKGPATVQYGDNAFAGVINIIMKKGTTKEPKMTVGGELGNYQYKKGFLNLGGRSNFMDYFMSYSYQDTSGYRANNDYLANNYFMKVRVYPTEQLEANFEVGYHRDHYGMPGRLLGSDMDLYGRSGTVYPHDRGYTSDCYVVAEPRIIFPFYGTEVLLSFFNTFRDRWSKTIGIFTLGVSEYETVHHISSYEFKPEMVIDLSLGEVENKLKTGIDYFYAKDRVLSGNRLASQDEADVSKQTFALYVHDSIKLFEKFLCNVGVRGEWADYVFGQNRTYYSRDSKKIREAAFNAGVGYKYREKSQIYFDFSRAYRMPASEEYYQNKFIDWWTGQVAGGLNAGLKHQQGNSFELGIKDGAFGWLSADADVFLIDTKNEIYYDPLSWANTNYNSMTRRFGLELKAALDLFEGKVKPFVYWTLQKAYFKGGVYANKLVPFVPKSKAAAGITVSPIDGFKWTINYSYTGSRYLISDPNNVASKLKPYSLFDTTFEYKFKELTTYFTIKNLFDVEYYAYGVSNGSGAETFYPAPQRIFEFGFTMEF